MNIENTILREDIEAICTSSLLDYTKIDHTTFLITGSTGLIGSIMVRSFLLRNEQYQAGISMILPVRNIEKAKGLFGENDAITYIESPIETLTLNDDISVDYIIHAASPTKSKYFITYPVETLNTAINGTQRVLEIAKERQVKGMVYLSSMEMYGVLDSENVTENDLGYIDPLNVRSSYSQGKRTSELYCFIYMSEYDISVKIARIAMTFGAGLPKTENRVYKYFADCILNKKDIVLKSSGTTCINYSYTVDTVIGLLYILLNGKKGEAYNLVGDKTNMNILESAKWLAKEYGEGQVNVRVEIPKENAGFAPDNKMILSNEKLKSIGWKPHYTIKEGYKRLLEYLKNEAK